MSAHDVSSLFFVLTYFVIIGELIYLAYKSFFGKPRPTSLDLRIHGRAVERRMERLGIASAGCDEEWVCQLRRLLAKEAAGAWENLVLTVSPYFLGSIGSVFYVISIGRTSADKEPRGPSNVEWLLFIAWSLVFFMAVFLVSFAQRRLYPDDVLAVRLFWLFDDAHFHAERSGLRKSKNIITQIRDIRNAGSNYFSAIVRTAGSSTAVEVAEWKKSFDDGLNTLVIQMLRSGEGHRSDRRWLAENYLKVILSGRHDMFPSRGKGDPADFQQPSVLLVAAAVLVVLILLGAAVFLPGWAKLIASSIYAVATIALTIFGARNGEKLREVISAMRVK